ncbi:MAG TPA: DUF1003 domain-containing protein [Steroidobacteraceae bacterium]|nr:DUF1003 domain-containing protein [Steroidobacteraceae bacterium]
MQSKPPSAPDAVPASISQNIEAIGAYYKREEQRTTRAQRLLERLGDAIGRPLFLSSVLLFVAMWILANVMAPRVGMLAFDPPPFSGLQGIVSLSALLITAIVLIGQNRLAKLEQRRGELELQVNILTEQKTTTLIRLIEELRRDLPMVPDRHDADAAKLQVPTDANQILSALEQKERADEGQPKG